ncbi:MAG: hypothetical protein HIU89_15470 [Proteobacteria bacterium]|nr:hypothetical protein [Pseudomonadota bacterium]
MVLQYVHLSRYGLLRIVRHGHRWRALLNDRELGRHETAVAALTAVRDVWPRERIPSALAGWRTFAESTNRLTGLSRLTQKRLPTNA